MLTPSVLVALRGELPVAASFTDVDVSTLPDESTRPMTRLIDDEAEVVMFAVSTGAS